MTNSLYSLLVLLCLLLLWPLAVWLNRRAVRRHEDSGDPHAGVIIFAEPIRWLFIIWGFAWFCAGLRRRGCRQQVRLFRWCSPAGALLVVPDLVRNRWQLRHAERLAGLIDELAATNRMIHLVGYSSGTFIVLEACRRTTHPEVLGKVVLLAGSVSSRYPLETLVDRLREVHSFHSLLDLITGLGPWIFGSNDRRWSPAAGTIGFNARPPFLIEHAWTPADIRWGYWGDHFTIAWPTFVADRIAPILMRGGKE